jgi:hypothetical protein
MTHKKAYNTAGIIPILDDPKKLNLPWIDCLSPVGRDYLAIERAVIECVIAGCDSVWIYTYRNTMPLLRRRVGEWYEDPIYQPEIRARFNPGNKIRYGTEKRVPIFYVPAPPSDKDRRETDAWGVLQAADRISRITTKATEWIIPRRYYVSFPNVMYEPQTISPNRKHIFHRSGNGFFTSVNGKTILDGVRCGFAINSKDIKHIRLSYWKESYGTNFPIKALRTYAGNEAAYKYMNYKSTDNECTFEGTYKDHWKYNPDKVCKVEIPWYYDISNWDGYLEYLSSGHAKTQVRHGDTFEYNELSPFGVDVEEDKSDSQETT